VKGIIRDLGPGGPIPATDQGRLAGISANRAAPRRPISFNSEHQLAPFHPGQPRAPILRGGAVGAGLEEAVLPHPPLPPLATQQGLTLGGEIAQLFRRYPGSEETTVPTGMGT